MALLLPQQRLLLELINASGDIAAPETSKDSLLWRTLQECEKSAWIVMNQVAPGFHRVKITEKGRAAIK
ncbi:MAG: hypothetical protein OQJ99_06240 [Rhodospirillales bacterium]|nr:hypothetical protein [Rhodospirillales bacterium]MCW8862008.1 hypothetical protein [Rhodospirillales bacterium]MCW8952976.1 hypothetical protein [Rhodospirillales bacterium]MCW8970630.1 hypothetical protein [Rhodospirillales bacterium]MCW9002330.1 hypothetical protein [Rhodospirillales bacterium]